MMYRADLSDAPRKCPLPSPHPPRLVRALVADPAIRFTDTPDSSEIGPHQEVTIMFIVRFPERPVGQELSKGSANVHRTVAAESASSRMTCTASAIRL
jgi:hypothetical protein